MARQPLVVVRVEDRGYEWECVLRPRWTPDTVAILAAYCLVWGLLIWAFTWPRPAGPTPDRFRQDLLGPLFALAMFTLLGYYLIWGAVVFLRWMLKGEMMTVAGGIVNLRWPTSLTGRAEFPLSEVIALEIEAVEYKQMMWKGWLRIRTTSRRYGFGRGLNAEQAVGLRDTIKQRFGEYMSLATVPATRDAAE